jgi:glycerol-3-phosphate acyltransferase PlsY
MALEARLLLSAFVAAFLGGLPVAAAPGGGPGSPALRVIPGFPAKLAWLSLDAGKSGAALLVSLYWLHLPPLYSFVPAWMALAGHLVSRARGGREPSLLAPALGIYAVAWATALIEGSFDLLSCAVVLAVGLITAAATRSRQATGMVLFFSLALLTPLTDAFGSFSMLVTLSSLFLLALEVSAAAAAGFFQVYRRSDIKLWRILARPFALSFVLIDILWTRKPLLLVLGSISLLFIALDLVRLTARLELSTFFKAGEVRRFSSITGFLVAVFIMFLVFPDTIPYLGLACLTMGDLFGKFVGIKFGKRPVIGRRTWEGSAAYFCGSLLFGYVLHILVSIPLPAVPLASLCAAATELGSRDLDDNFTVGIVTGAFLTALRHFLVL